MCLKEFLKPTKAKVILAAAFFAAFILLYILLGGTTAPATKPIDSIYMCCLNMSSATNCEDRVLAMGQEAFDSMCSDYLALKQERETRALNNNIIAATVALIISYLASCAAIAVYRKVKK